MQIKVGVLLLLTVLESQIMLGLDLDCPRQRHFSKRLNLADAPRSRPRLRETAVLFTSRGKDGNVMFECS